MGLAFGGPYDGFTLPSMPGESDKHKIVETHIQVFKVFFENMNTESLQYLLVLYFWCY